MRGEMLWFNHDKGHGFIKTEDDERLLVSLQDFRPGELPEGRCKGMVVAFDREGAEGADDAHAVDVHFVTDAIPPRARLRRARGGSSL